MAFSFGGKALYPPLDSNVEAVILDKDEEVDDQDDTLIYSTDDDDDDGDDVFVDDFHNKQQGGQPPLQAAPRLYPIVPSPSLAKKTEKEEEEERSKKTKRKKKKEPKKSTERSSSGKTSEAQDEKQSKPEEARKSATDDNVEESNNSFSAKVPRTTRSLANHSLFFDHHYDDEEESVVSELLLRQEGGIRSPKSAPSSSSGSSSNRNKNPPPSMDETISKLLQHVATSSSSSSSASTSPPWRQHSWATWVYGERTMVVAIAIHTVCTLVIWGHFALRKFREQDAAVPAQAPFRGWKVVAPTLEFGTMHAILFQMALLPLTMSRLTIALLSSQQNSALQRFLPLRRMLNIHIHLGYTMVLCVVAATVFFFAFFGKLCASGEQAFCDKFTTEIMITGYVIAGLLIIVGLSSFLRHVIPYEVFYALHHAVFLLYAVTTAHTLDNVQRNNERERSQTFRWYSASFLYYLCDRAAMYMNHSYKTTLLASSLVNSENDHEHDNDDSDNDNDDDLDGTRESSDSGNRPSPSSSSSPPPFKGPSSSSKMIILKVLRPALFRFQPGQYAHVRIPEIDALHYHPFSIASAPGSDFLEFYMEVVGKPSSWTRQLWWLLQECAHQRKSRRRIVVELLGPYGTSLGHVNEYSHCVAVGGGTGIVPIISLLKQHVRQLVRLDPQVYFRERALVHEKMAEIRLLSEQGQGSLSRRLLRWCCATRRRNHKRRMNAETTPDGATDAASSSSSSSLSQSSYQRNRQRHVLMRQVQQRARAATRAIYGTALLTLLPAVGFLCMGLTLSWATRATPPEHLEPWMPSVLKWTTFGFQGLFLVALVLSQETTELKIYMDVAFWSIGIFADWYWCVKHKWGMFGPMDTLYYLVLLGYLTVSSWHSVVVASVAGTTTASGRHCRQVRTLEAPLEKLHVVWVTRSAALVSKILPDLADLWKILCEEWKSPEAARQVLQLSIYVTDRRASACAALQQMMQTLGLDPDSLHLERPCWTQLLKTHTLELVHNQQEDTMVRYPTHSLLAFCGSPHLSAHVHRAKLANDVWATILGEGYHSMEYVSECYGASRQKRTRATRKKKTTRTTTTTTPTGAASPKSTAAAPPTPNDKNDNKDDDKPERTTTNPRLAAMTPPPLLVGCDVEEASTVSQMTTSRFDFRVMLVDDDNDEEYDNYTQTKSEYRSWSRGHGVGSSDDRFLI